MSKGTPSGSGSSLVAAARRGAAVTLEVGLEDRARRRVAGGVDFDSTAIIEQDSAAGVGVARGRHVPAVELAGEHKHPIDEFRFPRPGRPAVPVGVHVEELVGSGQVRAGHVALPFDRSGGWN